MTRLTLGGSEAQASPITYPQEVEEEAVEEEAVEEEAVEEGAVEEEVAILEIRTIEDPDRS